MNRHLPLVVPPPTASAHPPATRYTCQFPPVTCLGHITVTSIGWGWIKATVTVSCLILIPGVITPTVMFMTNTLWANDSAVKSQTINNNNNKTTIILLASHELSV